MGHLSLYVYLIINSTINTILHSFGLYLLITTKIRRSNKSVNHLYLINYSASALLKNLAYMLYGILRIADISGTKV